MSTIALIGAGGKMGCRLTNNFLKSSHKVYYVETGEKGLANLRARNIAPVPAATAVPQADVVVLAVPDVAIEAVSREMVLMMKPGAMLMALDPAAPLDGKLYRRDDITYFVAHPCHPSLFNWEPTEAAFRDFYGGISAKQAIVCTLLSGPETDYARGEAIAREMYAPVKASHRITLEQMATLEPALVETLAQTCMEIIREGYDLAVKKGIPPEVARDFLLGHLRIQAAVLFQEVDGGFSDAAYKISRRARPMIFRDDWQRIFADEDIRQQVRNITH